MEQRAGGSEAKQVVGCHRMPEQEISSIAGDDDGGAR